MSFRTVLAWRVARCALSVKVALLLVLTTPGLITPTAASASLNPQGSLAFIFPMDAVERELAVDCLADAVYYEAAFEPEEGQRAVAQVVLNRVRDPNFPDTVCGVVYQGWERKTGCQFSFACDGSLKRRPPEADQAKHAKQIAIQALKGAVVEGVGTATHYHTDYVRPYWGPSLVKTAKVGQHIFYRWPGKAGLPSALDEVYEGGEAEAWSQFVRFADASKAKKVMIMKSYTCFIHRPHETAPNFLAVTCADAERAMILAERAARECQDWRVIEVFEGERRVAVRARDEADQ